VKLLILLYVVVIAALFVQDARGETTTRHSVLIGASGGSEVDKLRENVGGKLATHLFRELGDTPVTTVKYISIEPETSWEGIADGDRDADIRKWANALARVDARRLVTFSHEPQTEQDTLGTAAEFKAAWRHVVTVFRDAGADRVKFVWVVAWTTVVMDPTEVSYLSKWYVGDTWTDYVSTEIHNRGSCTPEGWVSFGWKAAPFLAWNKAHDKPILFAEVSANDEPRRVAWLNNATRYVKRHPLVAALFYYQSPLDHGCNRPMLDSEPEYDAFQNMIEELT
jgi:hypothetical protein